MNLRQGIAVAALCGALTACVSTKTVPLDAGNSAAFFGKSVVLAERGAADFAVTRVGNSWPGALLGPVGGAIAAHSALSEGNELVHNNQVDDPAIASGHAILAALAAKYNLVVRDAGGIPVHGEQPEEIRKAYPGIDFVLDIETLVWTAIYFPGDWSHFGIIYRARLRLFDGRTGKVVAEASCIHKPEKQPDSPTYEQLIQDGAARLKVLSNAAGDACRDELRSKLALTAAQ